MFRITATLIDGEDRVKVEIDKDDANTYEIGAAAMAMDNIVEETLKRGFGKLLGDDNEQEEEATDD